MIEKISRTKVDLDDPTLNRREFRALERRVGKRGQVKQRRLGPKECAQFLAQKASDKAKALKASPVKVARATGG